MQKKQLFRRHAAVLTAAALTVGSLPVVAASSAEYNTWTGYVLRNAAGQYLSVSGGTEGEGAQVGFYDAVCVPAKFVAYTSNAVRPLVKLAIPNRICVNWVKRVQRAGVVFVLPFVVLL